MMQGHGMRRLANAPDETPKVTWDLLRRVMTYARPYRGKLVLLLVLIGAGIGLSLLSPFNCAPTDRPGYPCQGYA